MEDPTSPGHYILYFVTVARGMTAPNGEPTMVVGASRSVDSLSGRWIDLGALWATDRFNNSFLPGSSKVESPHVFAHTKAGTTTWRMLFSTSDGHPIHIENRVGGLPYDASASDSSTWQFTSSLYNYLLLTTPPDAGAAAAVANWAASEYLQVGGREYLAAFDDNGIHVAQMFWTGSTPDQFDLRYPTAAVENDKSPKGRTGARLRALGRRSLGEGVHLEIDLPVTQRATLEIFDVSGRCVRKLAQGMLSQGVTLKEWGCVDASDRAVGCGIYFAKLTTQTGSTALKLVVAR